MSKKYITIICVVLFTIQQSVAQVVPIQNKSVQNSKFSFLKIGVPVGLITLGSLCRETNIDQWMKKQVSFFANPPKRIDDYSQYLPLIGVFTMSNLGVKAKNNIVDRVVVTATAFAFMGVMVNTIKYTVKVKRPDKSSSNSFPSGHTGLAFTAAELLWQEYKNDSLWIGIGGYAIASFTGLMRIYNNRHWLTDVVVGAGIGMLSGKVAYELLPWVKKKLKIENKSNKWEVCPFYHPEGKGIALTIHI